MYYVLIIPILPSLYGYVYSPKNAFYSVLLQAKSAESSLH
jgi:hypothetical protein